ncbi:MAG: hypothetical protein J7623_06940 [Chitinophaga sp.]|uniref:hypothetical protein n=1 Tax=Chitinophaga sp. TaxID=1869181 RepID=UPI001B0E0133|nr:hypothetical protein [Chitinophaga sp.]MBO9728359.1 hypothetical protein [Chitinophaga sp.]
MKYIILLPIAIWLFACNNGHHAPNKKMSAQASFDSTPGTDDTTEDEEYGIDEDEVMPPGFSKDSVHYWDSALRLDVTIIHAFTTDGSMAGYSALVNRSLDTALQECREPLMSAAKEQAPDPETADEEKNEFVAFPLNYYQDENIVSVRFGVSMNSSGASHAISYLKSVNYDKKSQKPVEAGDYFIVKNSHDSSLLIKLMDRRYKVLRDHTSDDPWTFYGLSHIIFNVSKDTVTFSFGDYALGQGPSMMEYRVSKQELMSVINPRYR